MKLLKNWQPEIRLIGKWLGIAMTPFLLYGLWLGFKDLFLGSIIEFIGRIFACI